MNLMTSPPTPHPKQWKNALFAVHLERRCLLAVERTEPLPCGPAPSQRHAFLDDLHDVRVRLQVVDEGGEEAIDYRL